MIELHPTIKEYLKYLNVNMDLMRECHTLQEYVDRTMDKYIQMHYGGNRAKFLEIVLPLQRGGEHYYLTDKGTIPGMTVELLYTWEGWEPRPDNE